MIGVRRPEGFQWNPAMFNTAAKSGGTNLTSTLGNLAMTALPGLAAGHPLATAASIFGPMAYEYFKGDTEAEKRTAQWQQQREQMLVQAQQMALPLAQGRRTQQQIEAGQRRAAQAGQAALGRGMGGAAFQRGVTEAVQRTEGELASQQEQQNRMMGLQMLQGVQQQMPEVQQYYQQAAAAEAMQRGKRFDAIKALALQDTDTQNLIKMLVKAGGKDGFAAWLEKVIGSSPTSFDSKTPPTWTGSPEPITRDSEFVKEILAILGLSKENITDLEKERPTNISAGRSGISPVEPKSVRRSTM